jgi:hypothetical protein
MTGQVGRAIALTEYEAAVALEALDDACKVRGPPADCGACEGSPSGACVAHTVDAHQAASYSALTAEIERRLRALDAAIPRPRQHQQHRETKENQTWHKR